MYTLEIGVERLKEAVKKADKTCGTLEPTNRKLVFTVANEKLYVLATDGCLTGIFEISPFIFSKAFSAFEVPLDVVKQFLSELSGTLIFSYQDQILTLKCYSETLRLRTSRPTLQNLQDPHFSREIATYLRKPLAFLRVNRRRFISSLDFVSAYLEEGTKVDVVFHGGDILLFSESSGVLTHSRLQSFENDLDDLDSVWSAYAPLSIPFVSSRHLIKALEVEQVEEIELWEERGKLLVAGQSLYISCADKPELSHLEILGLLRNLTPQGRIPTRSLQKVLRRALIAGRYSEVDIQSRHGQLTFISHHGSITYKASLETSVEANFSVKARAYVLRTVLGRLNSQNTLISVEGQHVIFYSPSLTMFILLRNQFAE
ncbi:hypothetical protein [Fervidobacterium thailandense]|uniref:DNA polymerase III subunit beta n=1 Tax=Fervidobacterium thailandense TaxID=1008305 RepID=A0A1E3G333_9BACT|nr:hypothetical protein [Fervidobacterium thailandense]ODN30681.1 hypothetical protein A4H02_03860 [Fervidobacterium thailandense]